MNRLISVLVVLGLAAALLAQPTPPAPNPNAQPATTAIQVAPGLNLVLYPTPGTPLTVHLHGAQGELHVWVADSRGAQVAPPASVSPPTPSEIAETKKLEAIKKLLGQQKPAPAP